MEGKVINLKVFYKDEARRFTVDESACTSLIFIKEKLQTIFPALRRVAFKITWKDTEGDEITISSDDDLIIAFMEQSAVTKVLHVSSAGENKTNGSQSYGTSANANQGCPFSSGNGLDLKDMHALGAMARQYLGPVLETLNAQAQTTGASTNNKQQEGLLMDIIRNAAEGFLGNNPMDKQQQNQSGQQTTQQKPSTSKDKTENAAGASTQPPNASAKFEQNPNNSANSKTFAEALAQLQEMGFSNNNNFLTHLLECFDGNVPAVVKAMADMNIKH